jgi:hypothetical protein
MRVKFEFDDYSDTIPIERTMTCAPRKGDTVIFAVDAVKWSCGTSVGVEAFDVSAVSFVISDAVKPYARVWLKKKQFR